MSNERELILSLLKCDVLRIGNFKLKSGDFSPIYIDLRQIIHYPEVVKKVVAAIREKQNEQNLKTDTVCGVPYTAIPIASIFSAFYNIPLVMKRKEAKEYGTKKLVEGAFKTGQSCLIIEDIVCSGTSVMDTLEVLRKAGLDVFHCIVIVDKQQGGIDNLKKIGLAVHALLNIESIFNAYCSINKVESDLVQRIQSYMKENPLMPIYKEKDYSILSYNERARISNQPVAKRLLHIMEEKKTNLCVATDTNSCHELINLVKQIGLHICILKTHVDILCDFDENFAQELIKLSSQYNFLILEDRKLSDTGKPVIQQYKGGMYKIETWADIVTVHAISGNGTIEALKSVSNTDERACILVAEMLTDDALTNDDYKASTFQLAEQHTNFVLGYSAQRRYWKGKNLICLYPSVNLSSSTYSNYSKSPEQAIADGADIIIVEMSAGSSADVVASAIEYKSRGFEAYLDRISQEKFK